jgi:hypothetical protein
MSDVNDVVTSMIERVLEGEHPQDVISELFGLGGKKKACPPVRCPGGGSRKPPSCTCSSSSTLKSIRSKGHVAGRGY